MAILQAAVENGCEKLEGRFWEMTKNQTIQTVFSGSRVFAFQMKFYLVGGDGCHESIVVGEIKRGSGAILKFEECGFDRIFEAVVKVWVVGGLKSRLQVIFK